MRIIRAGALATVAIALAATAAPAQAIKHLQQ
jgi:hypothetical protein